MFGGKGDQLRMDLYAIDALRSQDKKDEALAALSKILPDYQDVPGGQAVQALINQMDPPRHRPPTCQVAALCRGYHDATRTRTRTRTGTALQPFPR